MTTFAHGHVVRFYGLYTSERHEIAEWLGLSRESPNETDVQFGKRVLLGAKLAGKLDEVAERIDKLACICERGHDRPYWTCPVHGYVTVEQ